MENEFDQLMRFYGVSTLEDLVMAQEKHIARLQEANSRKSTAEVLASSPVRSA